jgi:ribosomal protein L31
MIYHAVLDCAERPGRQTNSRQAGRTGRLGRLVEQVESNSHKLYTGRRQADMQKKRPAKLYSKHTKNKKLSLKIMRASQKHSPEG